MLDFGRFNGTQPDAGQGRPGPFQPGFMDEALGGYPGATSSSGASTTAAAVGGPAGVMPSDEGFNGGYPSCKPPAHPPPSPPGGAVPSQGQDFGFQNDDFPALGPLSRQASNLQMAQGSPTSSSAANAAAGGAGRGNGQIGSDLSRALLGPPPPPSQAPLVPPAQPHAPQGPPPTGLPLVPATQARAKSEEERINEQEELHSGSPEAEKAAREKYGLLGILKVIRMTDPDLNTLALGMDLTNLGLNLNSPECLYATFASPWSDAPARKDPEFYLPPCYYMNPPQLKTAHLQKFSWETLFYIFFNMPRDTLQAYAAAELYNRGWKYHRDLKIWFIYQEEEVGQPRWVCFDPTAWEKHYYHHPVDVTGFLTEDDVRVKIAPSGTLASSA